MVADHSNIISMTLNPECTTTEYIMSFLNKVFIGVADQISFSDSATITIFENDKIIGKHTVEKS